MKAGPEERLPSCPSCTRSSTRLNLLHQIWGVLSQTTIPSLSCCQAMFGFGGGMVASAAPQAITLQMGLSQLPLCLWEASSQGASGALGGPPDPSQRAPGGAAAGLRTCLLLQAQPRLGDSEQNIHREGLKLRDEFTPSYLSRFRKTTSISLTSDPVAPASVARSPGSLLFPEPCAGLHCPSCRPPHPTPSDPQGSEILTDMPRPW